MIKCKGYVWHSMDGDEYCCEYEPPFGCEDCIINGGDMSPVSHKPFRGNKTKYEQEFIRRELNKRSCKMKNGKLIQLLQLVPGDAEILSDSGWEVCETNVDKVFYNKENNQVVFTQKDFCKHYEDSEGWELLSNESSLEKPITLLEFIKEMNEEGFANFIMNACTQSVRKVLENFGLDYEEGETSLEETKQNLIIELQKEVGPKAVDCNE